MRSVGFVLLLCLKGLLAMDLMATVIRPKDPIADILESLILKYSGKCDAFLLTQLPDSYFEPFKESEKLVLEKITFIADKKKEKRMRQSFFADIENDLPVCQILDVLNSDRADPSDIKKGPIRIIRRLPGTILVHIDNVPAYDMLSMESSVILSAIQMICRVAQDAFTEIKEILCAEKTDNELGNVHRLIFSGHLSGTAAAQLLTIFVEADPDLELWTHSIQISSVGFGLFRFFSPTFVSKVNEIEGFDQSQFMVFASLEQYFMPNFGLAGSFGRVLELKWERLFEGSKGIVSTFAVLLESGRSNAVAGYMLLRTCFFHYLEISKFAELVPACYLKAVDDAMVSTQMISFKTRSLFSPGDDFGDFEPETDEDDFFAGICLKEQRVKEGIAKMVYRLRSVFKTYFPCLRDKTHKLTIQTDMNESLDVTVDNATSYFAITNRDTLAFFVFEFRIFGCLRGDDCFPEMGLYKVLWTSKMNQIIPPGDWLKPRGSMEAWCQFFQTQWSKLSGAGVETFKKINPFFIESAFFDLGDPNCYAALQPRPEYYMEKLKSTDPKEMALIRALFGPVKRKSYIDFPTAQRLIKTPLAESHDSLMNYFVAQNTLFNLVKTLFSSMDFALSQLIRIEDEALKLGEFTFRKLTSYSAELFSTSVTSARMKDKLEKPDCLHNCAHGLIGRHCPYFALRTPTNPFWKRVVRCGDLYMSFIGSDSFRVFGDGKLATILRFLGPEARPLKYSLCGAFVVLEVTSHRWGFGPMGQQGVFYMLLIQDPAKLRADNRAKA